MYRSAARQLLQSATAGGICDRSRPLSTVDVAPAPVEDSTFIKSWKKAAPHIDPPKSPLDFMKARYPTPASIPSKLKVNFVFPYRSEISSKEIAALIIILSHMSTPHLRRTRRRLSPTFRSILLLHRCIEAGAEESPRRLHFKKNYDTILVTIAVADERDKSKIEDYEGQGWFD
ncbi:uncharacterized protein A4U43_C03F12980 [Asparagus officinalis]|uniref:Uncharacterized protein n=1 Tax=Asparagus officinalis TaxID=4686 RepID=A0A5P1F9M2_ASPOF|nr:uncharacterized protein A4U43_C03F12980 [Asparagus officinalis]